MVVAAFALAIGPTVRIGVKAFAVFFDASAPRAPAPGGMGPVHYLSRFLFRAHHPVVLLPLVAAPRALARRSAWFPGSQTNAVQLEAVVLFAPAPLDHRICARFFLPFARPVGGEGFVSFSRGRRAFGGDRRFHVDKVVSNRANDLAIGSVQDGHRGHLPRVVDGGRFEYFGTKFHRRRNIQGIKHEVLQQQVVVGYVVVVIAFQQAFPPFGTIHN